MTKLRIAYFGSSDFSADFLERLLTDASIKRLIEVTLVVTQPDRPVDRKQIMTPTPVKEIAIRNHIPVAVGVASEVTLRHERQNLLRSVDLTLVYAFSQKIPADLLKLPKYGFWNIHPSLLPKYRGPAPIATPLINGDAKTGVTIIKMDEQIDHGPIIAQKELKILPDDRRPDLERKLTNLAFEMFCDLIKGEGAFFETIARVPSQGVAVEKNGTEPFMFQNHSKATYTKLLKKSDGFIEFEKLKHAINSQQFNNVTIYNLFRGLYPWPGLWTILPNGKRLKITDLQPPATNHQSPIIKRVQLEGKREVDFKTFQKAYKIF